MPAKPYEPPYEITTAITHRIAEIGESVGRITAISNTPLPPQLRRENRIRTIQASLAIENNTLTLEQVTAVVAGKRVLGDPREIQEVRNALAAYAAMDGWQPGSFADLLSAHALLMGGLTDEAGRLRRSDVAVFADGKMVHMAPPAKRVNGLVADLISWVAGTSAHPLLIGCVFHYELEFIHPFADGNGRMGRLWQTLIMQKWKPVLAWLPVETVIKERQKEYYRVLAEADRAGKSTVFIEFMLDAIAAALAELPETVQDTDQVTDQVAALIQVIGNREISAADAMGGLTLSHRPTFSKNYLQPALAAGLVERTQPGSPRSPKQRYRVTALGREVLNRRTKRSGR